MKTLTETPLPTLLMKSGFKFFFYANEHLPKHIHVTKSGAFAKIDLSSLTVVVNQFSARDLKKALEITQEYKDEFEKKWDEFFGR